MCASYQQLRCHNYHSHKKARLDVLDDSSPAMDVNCHTWDTTDNNNVDGNYQTWDTLDDNNVSHHIIPIDVFGIFDIHPPTKRFFEDLQQHSFEVAVQGLVARSCYQDPSIDDTTYQRIHQDEVALFFRIAPLVFKTGPQQQHLLAGGLSGFEMLHSPPSCYRSTMATSCLPLPITHKAFLATLINPTNQNLLTSIIPRPPTVVLSGRHAYITIPAILAYELGLAHAAVDPPYNPKFERPVNSEHGQELFNRAKTKLMAKAQTINCNADSYVRYVVLLLMWFDGWDPNGSSKGNRSPVWSGTLTMVFLNMEGTIVVVATYPFATGPGKADHDVIFQHILKDLRALHGSLDEPHTSRRWYSSRAAQQMLLLYAELFCIWQDQSARHQETNTLGGNSNNHAIFGISCYVKHLCKPIPACVRCRAATMEYLDHGDFRELFRPTCPSCTNWQFPDDPTLSLYQEDISDKFPADAVAGKSFNSGGGAITFTLLIAAWREACAAVTGGYWNDSTAQTYLKTLCVNEATIKAMFHQCRKYVLWTEIGTDPESYDEQTRAAYRRQYAAHPERFCIPKPPVLPGSWELLSCMSKQLCIWLEACKKPLPNLCIDMQPHLATAQRLHPD
jgi:hypothetical protein